MLFAATLRAWVRDVCASAIEWITADRTRWGQPFGRGIFEIARLCSMRLSQGGFPECAVPD